MAATPQLGGSPEIECRHYNDPPPDRRTPRKRLDGGIREQQIEKQRERRETRRSTIEKGRPPAGRLLSLFAGVYLRHFLFDELIPTTAPACFGRAAPSSSRRGA